MQLFLAGNVAGCTLTGLPASIAHCKWRLASGEHWQCLAGAEGGTSHSDSPAEGGSLFVFNHPLEVCYEAKGEGLDERAWPHIEVEIRFSDEHGRSDLGGYAVVHVPNAPGMHEISCRVWRPKGGLVQRIAAFFVGGSPQLKENSLVYGIAADSESGNAATSRLAREAGRPRVTTVSAGVVHLTLGVCLKYGSPGTDGLGGE
jgi:B9 domain-containing protein 2